jgi:branched-chain amino acid transport system ATP-binding protein
MTDSPVLALSLSNVSKAFEGLRAVDGVSLAVAAGERRALIGPNGAGKTTLFSLISGETHPTAGQITLFGRNVTRLPPHRRAAPAREDVSDHQSLPSPHRVGELSPAVQALTPAKLHLHRALSRYKDHLRGRALC